MSSVTVFHDVMSDRSLTEIRSLGLPAVLKGAVADWPAVKLAQQSDDALVGYLRQHDNGQVAGVYVGGPAIEGRFFYGESTRSENFRHGPAPIPQALDHLMQAKSSPHPPAIYVQSAPVAKHMPGFAAENRLALLPETIEPRIWIGNATVTRTHYDLNYNIACVVAGRRRVLLFPPEQITNLYPGPFDRTIGGVPVSMADPEAPDLARYPRFAETQAHMLTAELEPGDALYIPYGWWHHVRSLERINVLVNYWWDDTPVQPAQPYDALFHALLALRDMPQDHLRLWQPIFDYYVFGAHGDPLAHLPDADKGSLGPLTPELVQRIKASLKIR